MSIPISPGDQFTMQDAQGRRSVVTLGQKIAGGAAGTVFRIRGRSQDAVKIYNRAAAAKYEQKVAAMLQTRPNFQGTVAAWPSAIAMDRNRDFLGFVMPLLQNPSSMVQLLEVSNKALRRRKNVPTDLKTSIIVAHNMAAAVHAVHSQGHCIIDFNPQNFLVDRGQIVLLDCDGYSISAGGTVWKAQQYMPSFACPEANVSSSRGRAPSDFGADQDRFALAVHIHRLLNAGRHPTAGIAQNRSIPSTEQSKIDEGLMPAAPNCPQWYEHPVDSLFLSMPSELQALFSRAFDAKKTHNRPSAREWMSVLAQLLNVVGECDVDETHFHVNGTCKTCGHTPPIRVWRRRAIMPQYPATTHAPSSHSPPAQPTNNPAAALGPALRQMAQPMRMRVGLYAIGSLMAAFLIPFPKMAIPAFLMGFVLKKDPVLAYLFGRYGFFGLMLIPWTFVPRDAVMETLMSMNPSVRINAVGLLSTLGGMGLGGFLTSTVGGLALRLPAAFVAPNSKSYAQTVPTGYKTVPNVIYITVSVMIVLYIFFVFMTGDQDIIEIGLFLMPFGFSSF